MKKTIKDIAVERLFTWLIVLFVSILIISNIASTKIVAIGPVVFDAGTILFPFAYIIGDILTEVFGFKRTRRVILIGFVSLLIAVLTFTAVQYLPSDPSWPNQAAYESILGFIPRIAIASFIAYLIGETLNSYVLAALKVRFKGRRLWMRMISSSFVGHLVDTVIFSLIAFAGVIPGDVLVSLIVTVFFMKMATELVVSPITYRIIMMAKQRYQVDVYEKPTLAFTLKDM